MDLTYAQLSVTGPVREKNEDCVGFWQPETPELVRSVGIAAVIADGVGGTERGEVASQLAVQTTVNAFKGTVVETEPADLLRKIFNDANKLVYDASMHHREEGRMATTLTVSIFRNDEISIGHVGDSRVYLIRNGTLRRLTSDHSYVALQVKLGLVKERDAMASPMRSMITRSIGQDLICGYDVFKANAGQGRRAGAMHRRTLFRCAGRRDLRCCGASCPGAGVRGIDRAGRKAGGGRQCFSSTDPN